MAHGFNLSMGELSDAELGYIGGLLRLDQVFDEEAREKAFTDLANKHGPSPDRKG